MAYRLIGTKLSYYESYLKDQHQCLKNSLIIIKVWQVAMLDCLPFKWRAGLIDELYDALV